jgi:hypothetical protein
MDSLIDRIEAATGADREIDGLIFKAVFPDRDWVEFDDCWAARCPDDSIAFDMPPYYSASIDAAMGLMPEGCINLNIAEDGITTALVDGTQAIATTPALALCAAALRARGLG